MATLQSTTFGQNGHITLPAGAVGTRPTPAAGMIRYNNTSGTKLLEFYDGSVWRPVTGISAGSVGTGGDSITYGNNSIVHLYTTVSSTATFTPAFTGNVQVLVVAGGGGAGYDWCGGAGGGGVIFNRNFPVSSGTPYPITVGAGGAGGNSGNLGWAYRGVTGSNSIFSTLTASGGGGSGAWNGPNTSRPNSDGNYLNTGLPGGSGGGGGNTGDTTDSRTRVYQGLGTDGQGFPGGSGMRFDSDSNNNHHSGSGGGAGGPGAQSNDNQRGVYDMTRGGQGRATDVLGQTLYFGGGGGGGAHMAMGRTAGFEGGIGGGGGGTSHHGGPIRGGGPFQSVGGGKSLNAGADGSGNTGGAGGVNTGGGGGGGQHGSPGGSGVVIIKY